MKKILLFVALGLSILIIKKISQYKNSLKLDEAEKAIST